METLIALDRALLLLINAAHSNTLDSWMIWFSSKWFWIPFYLLLLWQLNKIYKPVQLMWVVLFVIVTIALADQISVHLFKFQFERLRPCKQPDLMHLLHLPAGCAGKYGFVSSHAANTAALTAFLWKLLKNKWLQFFLLLYVALNVYSRAYLGVHYPSDLVGGIGLGTIIGFTISKLPQLFISSKK